MALSMFLIGRLAGLVAVAVVLGGVDAKPPSKVVGGEECDIGEFPYQVSLSVNDRHLCGGTIIGKRHILTAAHCVIEDRFDPVEKMTVHTGSNSKLRATGKTSVIKAVSAHPGFTNDPTVSPRDDIAVITLTEDLVFDRWTQPAELPTEDTPGVVECVATGWGAMAHPSPVRPVYLRKADFLTIDNALCRLTRPSVILDSHLCAVADKGVGLCFGDSGGPLVHNGVVIGIASFVAPCATGYPDVFTRVYSYLDFIAEAMVES